MEDINNKHYAILYKGDNGKWVAALNNQLPDENLNAQVFAADFYIDAYNIYCTFNEIAKRRNSLSIVTPCYIFGIVLKDDNIDVFDMETNSDEYFQVLKELKEKFKTNHIKVWIVESSEIAMHYSSIINYAAGYIKRIYEKQGLKFDHKFFYDLFYCKDIEDFIRYL